MHTHTVPITTLIARVNCEQSQKRGRPLNKSYVARHHVRTKFLDEMATSDLARY